MPASFSEMNSNVNNRINDLRNQMTREHDILADNSVDTLTDTVKAHIDDQDLHRAPEPEDSRHTLIAEADARLMEEGRLEGWKAGRASPVGSPLWEGHLLWEGHPAPILVVNPRRGIGAGCPSHSRCPSPVFHWPLTTAFLRISQRLVRRAHPTNSPLLPLFFTGH